MTLLQFGAEITARDEAQVAAQAHLLQSAGVRWVQLNIVTSDWTERDLTEWVGILDDNGLEIGAIGCYANPLQPEATCPVGVSTLRRLVPLHPVLGSNKILTWSGALADGSQGKESFAAFMLEMLPLLEDHDAQLVIHPHPDQALRSASDCIEIVECCPQNRLTFVYDPALLCGLGGEEGVSARVIEEMEALASHLALAYLRDTDQPMNESGRFVTPGKGALSFEPILQALNNLMVPLLTILAATPAEDWASTRDHLLSSLDND